MITVFEHAKNTTKPNYVTVDYMLDRIKSCKIDGKIKAMRAEKDKAKRRKLKEGLPVICFSGRFSARSIEGCKAHSGFIVLDFDHLEDVDKRKKEVASHDFVYSCFVSPSGDGLKAVVRIPKEINRHGGYFRGLRKIFIDVDKSGSDVSRACFESVDKDIYINKNATVFTDYAEDFQKAKPLGDTVKAINTDYARANVALEMIRNSVDGEKHAVLLKASKLMGGYIAGGFVTESEAERLLEHEISNKGVDDVKAAFVTIKKGIDYGRVHPIEKTQPVKYQKQTLPTKINEASEDFSFLATKEETDLYITQKRNGTFEMGKKTGFPKLDEYFRFKDSQLDMVLGHDNAGKSIVSWYFALLDAYFNDATYIIFAGENRTGAVKAKLVEYYMCKNIENANDSEIENAKKWVEDRFALIRNDESYSYTDMINIGRKMLTQDKYTKKKPTKFIIEPYNVLEKETKNEHQYDYKAMLEIRLFIRQTGIGVLLNLHAATEALRKTYPKEHDYYGYTMPPNKADAEGGGKFPNKADNFLVVHRMADHPTEWIWTELHVQKIKESETGGKRTFKNEPFKMRLMAGGCGFQDENGYNPMIEGRKKVYPIVMTENASFLSDKPEIKSLVPGNDDWEDKGQVF